MTSKFDYNSFRVQHELHNVVRSLASHLREARGAHNAQIFPTVQGQPLPFADLLQELRIEETQEVEITFNFELTGVTMEEVAQHCRDDELDFMTFTSNRGNKLFYNSTYDEDQPNWVEMSRPEASDANNELSELIFLDPKNSVIDWNTSLGNLKRLARDRKYTEQMMHTALIRIINRFLPEQTLLLKPKTSNEIAVFLLRLDSRVDKMSHYRQQLFNFQRNPIEDLESVLARIQTLVDKMYPAQQAANTVHRENILKTAVISFVPDYIGIPLLEDIKRSAANCEPMSYQQIKGMALAAERAAQVVNPTPLQFGRIMNQSSVSTQMQFNSMRPFPTDPYLQRRIPEYSADLAEVYPGYSAPVLEQMYQINNRDDVSDISAISAGSAHPPFPAARVEQSSPQSRLSSPLLPNTSPIPGPSGIQGPIQQASQNASNLTRNMGHLSLTPNSIALQQSPVARAATLPARPADEKTLSLDSLNRSLQEGTLFFQKDNVSYRIVSIDPEVRLAPAAPSAQILTSTPAKADERGQSRGRSTEKGDKRPHPMITRSQERALALDPKLSSIQFGRSVSKDRLNRSQSNDKKRSDSKNNSGFRPRSQSRDKTQNFQSSKRSNSRDSRKDRYEQSKKSSDRSYSRSSQNSQSSQRKDPQKERSQSRDQEHKECKCYKCGHKHRSRSTNRDGNRRKSEDRDYSKSRAHSRDQSRDARRLYPEMKKGENCGYDYNPLRKKWCRKCPASGTHHEFQCYKYEKFSPVKCTVCEKYQHFGRDCKEVNSFPPKVSELNSLILDGKN